MLAALTLLGCGGPSIAGDEDESFTSSPSETSESETDGEDPFACEPWDAPAQPPGMGEPITLSFVDASAELGLVDTAYFPGEWPPGCDPTGEGWVTTPCKMYLQGGGAAVGDFDDDGWPDIYLARVGPGALLRNLEGQAFENVGTQLGLVDDFHGNGAAWVDVDGDDDLDLYVTSFGDPARFWFYRNTLRESGEAGFVEEAQLRGLALDDGEPHFGFSIAVGDYDRDGWLDLYTTEWRPGSAPTEHTAHARLLRNAGDGVYEDRTLAAGASMLMKNPAGMHAFAPAFVDLDEDGWLDLAVVSDNGTSRLFWSAGDGTFVDGTPRAGVSLEKNGMGSTFGDYDGDGHLDWYVSAIFSPEDSLECGNLVCGKGGNRLYRSKGPRCFEELGQAHEVHDGGWGWGTAFFDTDNDGDLDLIETNGFYVPHGPPGGFFIDEPLRFWRNDSQLLGEAGFSEAALEFGLDDRGQGRGLLVFDFDRDGDEDLLIVDSGGPYGTSTKLWRNESGSQNAWLAVELDGHAGNTRAVGARVELQREVGGPKQVRVIGVGTHFLGFGEHRAHFGLGPDEGVVAELRVIWPSGAQTVLTGVPARQLVSVAEP